MMGWNMAEETNSSFPAAREEGAGRGNRHGGGREPGGFRIRLSDNEMRAARALQEAFGLRSTVAVLGFALRTLGQQLEQGQLEELIQQHRSQAGSRPPGPRRGDRRRDRPDDGRETPSGRGQRVDPFARPSRPAPPAEQTVHDNGVAESADTEPEPLPHGTTDGGTDPELWEAAPGEVAVPADDPA